MALLLAAAGAGEFKQQQRSLNFNHERLHQKRKPDESGEKTQSTFQHGPDYRLSQKNCFVSEIGVVTVFCPLTITGGGRLVVQNVDSARFVVDRRVKPVELAGHDSRIFVAATVIISCGGVVGRERLNIVPQPKAPPSRIVP